MRSLTASVLISNWLANIVLEWILVLIEFLLLVFDIPFAGSQDDKKKP